MRLLLQERTIASSEQRVKHADAGAWCGYRNARTIKR